MSFRQFAEKEGGCGLIIWAFGTFTIGALVYGFVFGFGDKDRAAAIRDFQMVCVEKELRGADWDRLRKSDREEIAAKCADLTTDFRRGYGK